MAWTHEDRSHALLIALIFAAIIALIACAGYLTHTDWSLPDGAGHGTSLAAPVLGSERR